MNAPARRVLAVNLNYLGDALFTTPALSVLRAGLPGAQIDVLAGERAITMLEKNPDIDRLLVRPPRGAPGRNAALLNTLRAGDYDAVVLFQSILANAAVAFGAGIPVRVGFAQDGCRFFLSHPVRARRAGEHVVDAYTRLAYAALAEAAAGPTPSARLKLTLSSDDEAFARAFWDGQGLDAARGGVAGLVIGATRPQKRWPEDYWARLADLLWDRLGVRSLLLGGPDEATVGANIAAAIRSGTPCASAIGLTTPAQMGALAARCRLVVSGDSGPLHVATAVHTPVVALFGSTDPAETGPWSGDGSPTGAVLYDALSCAPCRKSPSCDGRFDCLRGLSPQRVFEAVAALLDASTGRHVLPMAAAAGGKVA